MNIPAKHAKAVKEVLNSEKDSASKKDALIEKYFEQTSFSKEEEEEIKSIFGEGTKKIETKSFGTFFLQPLTMKLYIKANSAVKASVVSDAGVDDMITMGMKVVDACLVTGVMELVKSNAGDGKLYMDLIPAAQDVILDFTEDAKKNNSQTKG